MTTDNIRLVLVILLSFIGLLLWEAWQRDYGPTPAPVAGQTQNQPTAAPGPATPANIVPAPGVDKPPIPLANQAATNTPPVRIETDLFIAEINPVGAVLQRLTLRRYADAAGESPGTFKLLDDIPNRDFIVQGGLKAEQRSADHYATFQSDKPNYQLEEGQDKLEVSFHWRAEGGLEVTRTFVFHRDSYEVEQRYAVHNGSATPWTFNHYEQLSRVSAPTGHQLVPTFTGVAVSTPEKHYAKHKFEDLKEKPIDAEVVGGWLAMVEHYFLAALIPDASSSQHYYSYALGNDRYVVGYYGKATTVAAGADSTVNSRLFLGPKLQEVLPKVAPGLELTVDYGVLWFIAELLFSTLKFLHAILGNWGWSIIVLTCLIKLAFWPLSAAGYRSMARMRIVQPRLLQLRERFPNDKAKLNQAMMEMYKTEKINPLGGCFPIVVQIPVFISLYWMILESVELRQAPFMFWIQDLSTKDPYYVLPALMLISMWLQTKMNPTPPDPIQAKVMQIMPLIFGVFFAFFPAGLVLYWFVNNVLSISQQWFITRQIESAGATTR